VEDLLLPLTTFDTNRTLHLPFLSLNDYDFITEGATAHVYRINAAVVLKVPINIVRRTIYPGGRLVNSMLLTESYFFSTGTLYTHALPHFWHPRQRSQATPALVSFAFTAPLLLLVSQTQCMLLTKCGILHRPAVYACLAIFLAFLIARSSFVAF
jgi:hypothetical protein